MILYFVRHQAEGVVWRFPFLTPPSDAQKAAVNARCAMAHGQSHPKTKEPYWLQVVEVDALNEGEIPAPPAIEAPGDGVSRIGIPPITMSGVGHIENPPSTEG